VHLDSAVIAWNKNSFRQSHMSRSSCQTVLGVRNGKDLSRMHEIDDSWVNCVFTIMLPWVCYWPFSTLPHQVQVIFRSRVEVSIRDLPLMKCQVIEPNIGDGREVIASIPIKLSVSSNTTWSEPVNMKNTPSRFSWLESCMALFAWSTLHFKVTSVVKGIWCERDLLQPATEVNSKQVRGWNCG